MSALLQISILPLQVRRSLSGEQVTKRIANVCFTVTIF
jgi:hypothetical protein